MKKDNTALSVGNLNKYFASSYGINTAVDNVSFNLNKGKIVGLIGESGSGKSTTANAIMNLLTEYNGVVELNGNVVSGRLKRAERKKMRKNIQMIFQNPHTSLNERKNVFTTLKEAAAISGVLKEEYANIFSSWNQVKESQSVSLMNHFYEKRSDLRSETWDISIDYYNELNKDLKNFKLEKTLKPLSNQIEFLFSRFYQDRLVANSEILGRYSKSLKNLVSYYDKKKEDIQNLKYSGDLEKKFFKSKRIIQIREELFFRKKLTEDIEGNIDKIIELIKSNSKSNIRKYNVIKTLSKTNSLYINQK